MQEHNTKDNSSHQENRHAGKNEGAQGIDKAPGEETPTEEVQFSQEAFKGKKVDADPTQENERPADQSSL